MADEHKTVILCFPADRPFVEESLGPVLNSRLFAAGEDNDASICISSADASTMDTWLQVIEKCSKLVVVVSAAGVKSVGACTNVHELLGEYTTHGSLPIRQSREVSSATLGQIEEGALITVSDAVFSDGAPQLLCEGVFGRGWVRFESQLLAKKKRRGSKVRGVASREDDTAGGKPRRRPARRAPRRHSVAEDGVSGVSALGAEVAKSLGVAAEEVFTVAQKHLKKAPTLIQLKVGGMGLTLFDGARLLESIHYSTIISWQLTAADKKLTIEKKGQKNKEISLEYIGEAGETISELMSNHCLEVKKAKKEQRNKAPVATTPRTLSDDESSDGGSDDGSSGTGSTEDWWLDDIRRTGDKLNLIEEPCVQRMLVTRKDRNVFFSGEVTDVKQDNKRYVTIVSHDTIYFMAHPGPPKDKKVEWVIKSRIKLHRLLGLVESEAIDDQLMLKAKTVDGREVRRYISLCDDRRDQFVISVTKQYNARVGSPLEVTDTAEAFGKAAATSVMGSAFTMETYQDRSVSRQHKAAELTFTLIIGINATVMGATTGQQNNPNRPLYPEDYTNVVTKRFPSDGSHDTLPHEYQDFAFTVHAPHAFLRLREKLGVDTAEYIGSFLGRKVEESDTPGLNPLPDEATLLEMSTNSKSGAFFFFTPDMRFLVKTVGHDEAKTLVEILPDFLQHYEKHPDSLINPIVGLYSTNLSKEPFIVMMNAFPLEKGIAMHEVYDLKGSMHGREIKEKEKAEKVVIYKDNDFDRNPQRAFKLGHDRYSWFLQLLEHDVGFLRDHGLIDYSLLVGIHFKQKGVTQDYGTNHIPARDGANEVYYIGVIDFLIKYHMKKKMEGNIRGKVVNMRNKNKDMQFSALSVTHPDEYSARMMHFITSKTPNPAMLGGRRRSSAIGVPNFATSQSSPTAGGMPQPGGRRRAAVNMGDLASVAEAAAAAFASGSSSPEPPLGGRNASESSTGAASGASAGLGSIAEDQSHDGEGNDSSDMTIISPRGSAHAGKYRVLDLCVARESREMSSARTLELKKGEVITVTESYVTDDDVTRLRFQGGWVTLRFDLLERDSETPREGSANPRSSPTWMGTGGRRASVAVDGVEGVTNDFSAHAESMGLAGEKVFMVMQSHLKKVNPLVHFKVGGMGIALFDGPTPLGSFIYTQIRKWTVQDHGHELLIELSTGSKPLVIRSAEASAISELMGRHAASVANANLLASPHKELLGDYRVASECPLFNNYRTDTEECGNLEKGDIVEALESGSTEHSIWLRCDQGWFPRDALFVVKVKATTGSDSPNRRSGKHGVWTQSVTDLNAMHSEQGPGAIAEHVFEVTQSHMKKCNSHVQLKVGGMGVHIFEADSVMQSFLYTDLVSWQFSRLREEVYISERGGMTVRLGTVEGEQIGSLMRAYALQISEAKDEEKSRESGLVRANLMGDYTVLETCWARSGVDTQSTRNTELQVGAVIAVVDVVIDDGCTRLKCDDGWVTLKPHTLERVEAATSPGSRPAGNGHSIAVHGVQTVASDMNDVASQMGLTGEQVYKVSQTHIRKAPKTVDMKVGGMGVTFFDPRGSVMLESHLYQNIKEWQYCRVQNHFVVTIKTGKGESEKRNVRLGMTLEQAMKVGKSMSRHAKGIKKAKAVNKEKGTEADDGKTDRADKLKEYYDSVTPGTPKSPNKLREGSGSEDKVPDLDLSEASPDPQPPRSVQRERSPAETPDEEVSSISSVSRESSCSPVSEEILVPLPEEEEEEQQQQQPEPEPEEEEPAAPAGKLSLDDHMRGLGLVVPAADEEPRRAPLRGRSTSAPSNAIDETLERLSSTSSSPSPLSRSASSRSALDGSLSSIRDDEDDRDSESPLLEAPEPALLQLFHAAVQRLSNDAKNSLCIFVDEYVHVPMHGELLKRYKPAETFVLSGSGVVLLMNMVQCLCSAAHTVHVDPQQSESGVNLAVQLLLPEENITRPLQLEGLRQPPMVMRQPPPPVFQPVPVRLPPAAAAGPQQTEQVQAASRAQQRARVLEQQLAELTRRHNTSTAAWSVERSWMLATSSNASSGSIIAELQAEEVQRENIRLQSRVKELIGDLQLQSELHDATFMADGGGGGGGEESGGAVDEQVYADLDALREENSLLRTASPAAADSAAAQLHVAELRGELGAAQKQTAALSAQTGQLQRQLNRHIEEKESALRQMRELQGSYRDMLLLKDTLSSGSPPSSPPTTGTIARSRSSSSRAAANGASPTGGLTRARNSAESVRRQVDSLERELRELVLMPPSALAITPRQLVTPALAPAARPPPSPVSAAFGSLALEVIESPGSTQSPAEVTQMLEDCGLGRYSSVLQARGLLSADALGSLGMGELGALGLNTTEKISLKRALRHAYGFGSPTPRGSPIYSTQAVGGEV